MRNKIEGGILFLKCPKCNFVLNDVSDKFEIERRESPLRHISIEIDKFPTFRCSNFECEWAILSGDKE